MASASLIRVIHDLRGPLNTLAILGEVLRSSGVEATASHREAIQTVNRTVANLGTMLEKVREFVDTMVSELAPVCINAAIEQAIAATPIPGVDITFMPNDAPALAVLSCQERLSVTLANLLACCAATLPSGGQLTVRVEATSRETHVTVTPSGLAVQMPPANSFQKVSPVRPGHADWFALCCRVEGLGGVLSILGDSTIPSVTASFPSCP
jgi:signal transduction histidine kinase